MFGAGAVVHLVMERAKVLETRTNNGLFTNNNDEKEEEEDDEARRSKRDPSSF